jgi:hypothetical protein
MEVLKRERLDDQAYFCSEEGFPKLGNDFPMTGVDHLVKLIALSKVGLAEAVGLVAGAVYHTVPEIRDIALEVLSPDIVGDDMREPSGPEFEIAGGSVDGRTQVAAEKVYEPAIGSSAASEMDVAMVNVGDDAVGVRCDRSKGHRWPAGNWPVKPPADALHDEQVL